MSAALAEIREAPRTGGKPMKWHLLPWMERELKERYNQPRTRTDKRQMIIDLARRFDVPDWKVRHWAGNLGLARVKEKPWSAAEVEYLKKWLPRRNLDVIARNLGRTSAAVGLKAKRLKLSRANRDGYSLTQLSIAFGEDHKRIRHWVEQGMLKASRWGTHRVETQGGDMWFFAEKDIERFVRQYPLAFDLKKVDQIWFLEVAMGLTGL